MTAYYNENDPKAAAWLRELIREGHIAPGVVDERSIEDVVPDELAGYTQCHFFAGIGGWSLALRIAGWPDDRPVWTGSCPCQPFSSAGKRKGAADHRHLWPTFYWIIAKCRPATVFGEQVASKDGRLWLAGVRADMEALGHAFGAADLCAAGVGAPHIRQRLWWVAHATGERGHGTAGATGQTGRSGAQDDCGRLDHTPSPRCQPEREWSESEARDETRLRGPEPGCPNGGMGDANHQGPQGRGLLERQCAGQRAVGQAGHWDSAIWLPCADGKARRIEPGLAPLAHGIPARVVRLRGYGNAIAPQVAAEFIQAAMEATP